MSYSCAARQDILRTVWTPKFHYVVHKNSHRSLFGDEGTSPYSSTLLLEDPFRIYSLVFQVLFYKIFKSQFFMLSTGPSRFILPDSIIPMYIKPAKNNDADPTGRAV